MSSPWNKLVHGYVRFYARDLPIDLINFIISLFIEPNYFINEEAGAEYNKCRTIVKNVRSNNSITNYCSKNIDFSKPEYHEYVFQIIGNINAEWRIKIGITNQFRTYDINCDNRYGKKIRMRISTNPCHFRDNLIHFSQNGRKESHEVSVFNGKIYRTFVAFSHQMSISINYYQLIQDTSNEDKKELAEKRLLLKNLFGRTYPTTPSITPPTTSEDDQDDL